MVAVAATFSFIQRISILPNGSDKMSAARSQLNRVVMRWSSPICFIAGYRPVTEPVTELFSSIIRPMLGDLTEQGIPPDHQQRLGNIIHNVKAKRLLMAVRKSMDKQSRRS